MKSLQSFCSVLLMAAFMSACTGTSSNATEAAAAAPMSANMAKHAGSSDRPLRVLMTGDSMTATGESATGGARSYRRRLSQLFEGAGIAVEFLGSNGDGSASTADPRHEAWGGAWIGPSGSNNNVFDRLPGALSASVDPDVVILALGWNSALKEPMQAADKYENLVARVALLKPRAQLVVATLSPFRGATEVETSTGWQGYRELNRRARLIAERSPSDRLHLADLAAEKFSAAEYDDDIHWNQAGADRAARIIFDTIVGKVLPQLP